MFRLLWLTFGILALIAGIIGILLPLIPTTPFLLVAAAAFAKSSPTFHEFLLNNKYSGPIIKEWQEKRTIPRRAIIIKIILMLISITGLIVYFNR